MTFKQTKFAIKKSRETVLLFHLSASFKFHVNLKAFQSKELCADMAEFQITSHQINLKGVLQHSLVFQ